MISNFKKTPQNDFDLMQQTDDSIPRVYKVTDHVYVAVGFALANMIMIEGNDGIVIVDTTESPDSAMKILSEFRKITSKPIKAIILTHFHTDHTSGASALLASCDDDGNNVKVFAHSTLNSERLKSCMMAESIVFGAQRQFGLFLKDDQHQGCGIGPFYCRSSNVGKEIMPTDTFDKEYTITIAGVTLQLLHTPGETNDQISVWIPEWRVVMPADNIYKAFPNLYALRGSPSRNCEDWYRSLDKVKRLRPLHMVPSHTEPISGEEKIDDIITHYRDAIQFVHDQSIRLLNLDLETDEIVRRVSLPQRLASHPYLQERYGSVSWSVRGIVSGKHGWFDRDPINIYPLSKQMKAEKFKELNKLNFSSSKCDITKMLDIAEESVNKATLEVNAGFSKSDTEICWSLELSMNALRLAEPLSPHYEKALSITLPCLKALASSSKNPTARNYFLACAMELSTKGFVRKIGKKALRSRINSWPISYVMEKLRFLFRAEESNELDSMTIIFVFPDVNQQHSYTMRHCILEYHNTTEFIPKNYDVKVTCASIIWRDFLAQSTNLESFLDKVDVLGSVSDLDKFVKLLDVGWNWQKPLKHHL